MFWKVQVTQTFIKVVNFKRIDLDLKRIDLDLKRESLIQNVKNVDKLSNRMSFKVTSFHFSSFVFAEVVWLTSVLVSSERKT